MDVTDGEQLRLFETGEPKRWKPTEAELEKTITEAVRTAVWKRHRGRPPRGMNWEDLYQEVTARALERVKNFQHGGKFTLFEFCYVAACYSLTDIQREELARNPQTAVETTPLLDVLYNLPTDPERFQTDRDEASA